MEIMVNPNAILRSPGTLQLLTAAYGTTRTSHLIPRSVCSSG